MSKLTDKPTHVIALFWNQSINSLVETRTVLVNKVIVIIFRPVVDFLRFN
jgi:hypothetical protein